MKSTEEREKNEKKNFLAIKRTTVNKFLCRKIKKGKKREKCEKMK